MQIELRMVYSWYKKQRIIYYNLGNRALTICSLLWREGLWTSHVGIAKFIERYNETGSLSRKPGSSRPSKITKIKAFVEVKMQKMTRQQLISFTPCWQHEDFKLAGKNCTPLLNFFGLDFQKKWLLSAANKQKRLEWARQYLQDNFDDVVWTDECSVQLKKNHKRFCCRKQGQPLDQNHGR